MGIITLLMLAFFVTNKCFCAIPSTSVNDLFETLLTGYNIRVRPMRDHNITTEIVVHCSPSLLVSLDTTSQKLSLIAYFTFDWEDEFLVWNASEYQGKQYIRLRVEEIWHPQIKLGLIYDGNNLVGHDHDKVRIDSSGLVQWVTEGLFNLVCLIDVTYYPFDTQGCDFRMHLPDEYSSDVQLSFDSNRLITQFKLENGEWKVNDMQILRHTYEETSSVRFHLRLERRAAFTLYTSVVPLVSLFILNTFVLLVPVGSGEKGSIAITFLLSFSVYISSISEHLPTNSLQTPIVLKLMIIMLIESSLILLVAIEQSGLYHYDSKIFLPKALSKRILCCRQVNPISESETADQNKKNKQHLSTDKDRFKSADRFLFYIAVIVNVTILISFALVFKLKSA